MKQIKLNPNGVALVDDADFEYLNKFRWYLSAQGYAIGGEKTKTRKAFEKMHRFVMNISDPNIKIDHKDGNKLNNQKINLRRATPAQNTHNSKKAAGTKNNYKGTNYLQRIGLWQSRCRMNGLDFFLGHYKSEIAAAYAYNKKALELSEFSRINYLPFSTEYLEALLISDFSTRFSPTQSKYKYIKFKKKANRMKCDKWYISFKIDNNRTTKGNFLSEDDALKYLIQHFSKILPDAGSIQDKSTASYLHLSHNHISKIQSPLSNIQL